MKRGGMSHGSACMDIQCGICLIYIKKSNHLKKCPKTVWIFMRILWAIKNQFCPRAKNVLRYLFCSMKYLLLKDVILCSSSSSEDNTIKLQSNQPFHLEASWQGQKVVKIELMLFFRVELFARWLSPTTVDYKHFQPPKTSLNEKCMAIKRWSWENFFFDINLQSFDKFCCAAQI